MEMFVLSVQMLHLHGLTAMMLQQLLFVFQDFILIQVIASIVLFRMNSGKLVSQLHLPFPALILLTSIVMPVLLAQTSMHHAHVATQISLHLNVSSAMISTILQAPHPAPLVKVEFLTVLDALMMVKEEPDASIVVMIMFLLTIIPVLLVEFSLATVKAVNNTELDKENAILVLLATSLLMVLAVFSAQAKSINALIVIKLMDSE